MGSEMCIRDGVYIDDDSKKLHDKSEKKPTTSYSLLKIPFDEFVFSSPELKAQVSFSDRLSSVVCPSVCPSVCLSVCLSVNFSYFRLLLKNHWANLNQTWHKASLGEGDSSLFK